MTVSMICLGIILAGGLDGHSRLQTPDGVLGWFGWSPLKGLFVYLPITNYQMAPSKRGAGGGSATHKEPT